MRVTSLFVLTAGLGLVFATVAAIPVSAHHSFAAEFDSSLPVNITGTVTKLEWANPHARVYVDVKDETGKVINWDFELGSPNGLMRRGWTRNSLKFGDVVTVVGTRAKNAPHVGNARTFTLADGKKVFAGSSQDEPQQN